MRIKATIEAYAFSVQCFENATIVAYAGLRVKHLPLIVLNNEHLWPRECESISVKTSMALKP